MPKVDCLGHDLGEFTDVALEQIPYLKGFVPEPDVPLEPGTIRIDYPGSKIVNNDQEYEMVAFITELRKK